MDAVEQHLIQWGAAQSRVRALILTSSKAIPNAPVDLFSDYDVILVTPDVLFFHEDRAWLEAFGPLLALYRDPLENEAGALKSGYVVQYENGLKIDFSLWAVEIMPAIAAQPQLQPEFDAGYRVLLDKDGLTEGLKPPTYQAYIPTPPTERRYLEVIEVAFVETTYVAKLLWRDDVVAAKMVLDYFMKHEDLLPMLEWHMETEHNWSVKPGPHGRRLKRWLRPDLWAELEGTYTGAGIEDNWAALERAIDLLRKAALEVGQRLGYAYPHELERRTRAYLRKVKALPRDAKSFPGTPSSLP